MVNLKENILPKGGARKSLNIDNVPNISIQRLENNIIELGKIGRNEEDGGVYRAGYSQADFEAREWLMEKLEAIKLDTYIDGAGNVFGRHSKPGTKKSFLIGSHLDSVPKAGALDGAYGVLAALEVMQVIQEHDIPLKEDLELVATADEEGRFGGMIGSEAICGEVSLDRIRKSVDSDGIRLTSELDKRGLTPLDLLKARRNPEYMSGFLELHIEQGPVLDQHGLDIGIVEGVSGVFHWSITLLGKSNHSGTTPMSMRRDAFQGLAEFSNEIPRVLEENGGEEARVTIGKVQLTPSNPHTIPGAVEFSLVGRDFTNEGLTELEHACQKTLSAICRRRELKFEFQKLSRIAPTTCDPRFVELIEGEAQKLGVKYLRMPSGAGHDAQIFGRVMPSGMIFIPSLNGISHSPDEWSSLEHIEMGAELLLRSVLKLLKKP